MASTDDQRLSVPRPRKAVPRPLDPNELAALTTLGDALCGPHEQVAPPSGQDEYPHWLEVALAARADSFELILELAAEAAAADDRDAWLRRLHQEQPASFQVLSAVLAGAYLMVPTVKAFVGYPGQRRDPAGIEEAVDQISDGILDPVIERGHFFVPTPEGA